jgi:transmembrane sensor
MSAARETGAAVDVKVRAAEWLMERSLSENWLAEDQAKLDAWLAQSPAHEVAFARMEATWDRTERFAALNRPTSENATLAPRRRLPPLFLKLAAGFAAIAALGAVAANIIQQPRDRIFATPIGGHETVSFADGSRVELNTNTILRTRMTTEERVVWLERGEAFFQVKHDAMHPFIVVAGNHRVTDLGTQFVVRHDASRVQVAVVQGRVWLEASEKQKAAHSTLLMPGDMATATASAVSITRSSTQTLSNNLGWRRGVLVFNHTTLADAAAQFNRYNRQKIVIADSVAAARTIGGTFPTDGVDDFAHLAQSVLGLRVTVRGEEIVISR